MDNEDYMLSAEQLDCKYNPDGDGEHPDFKREDWRLEVKQHNTLVGYWDWVNHKIDELDC